MKNKTVNIRVNDETQPTPDSETIPLKYLPQYKCRVEKIDLTRDPGYISMRAKEYSKEASQEWEIVVEDNIVKALREKHISHNHHPRHNRWGFVDWRPFINKHIYRLSDGVNYVNVFYKNPDNDSEEYLFTYSIKKTVEQDRDRIQITFG